MTNLCRDSAGRANVNDLVRVWATASHHKKDLFCKILRRELCRRKIDSMAPDDMVQVSAIEMYRYVRYFAAAVSALTDCCALVRSSTLRACVAKSRTIVWLGDTTCCENDSRTQMHTHNAAQAQLPQSVREE